MKKMDGFWSVANEGEKKKKEESKKKLELPKPIIMQPRRDLDNLNVQVRELRANGLSNVAIAKRFGVSSTTIAEWLKRKVKAADYSEK